MKTKLITLPDGKRVKCRALAFHDLVRVGDYFPRTESVVEKESDFVGQCAGHCTGYTVYRPISKPTRKPRPSKGKAVKRGVKAIKAWAVVGKSNTFTLQQVCSTRERAYFECGRWNDHNTCDTIKDELRRVVPVRITPLRRERSK
jgi:hypothetical protein